MICFCRNLNTPESFSVGAEGVVARETRAASPAQPPQLECVDGNLHHHTCRGEAKGKGRGKRCPSPQASPDDTEDDPSLLAKLLSDVVVCHEKNQDMLERQVTAEPELEDHYSRSCTARMKKLSPLAASFLQIQITQLFYEEHPSKQIPVISFPVPRPPPERHPHPPPPPSSPPRRQDPDHFAFDDLLMSGRTTPSTSRQIPATDECLGHTN